MARLVATLLRLPDLLCGVLGLCLALLLTATAIGRYLNLFHLMWANEVSQWMFLWLALLGAAIAVRDREHFRMTSILDRLPPSARKILETVNRVLALIVGGFVLGVGILIYTESVGSYSGILRVPTKYIYLAFSVSGALMLLYGVQEMRGPRRRKDADST